MDLSLKRMIATKWKWIAAIAGIVFILFMATVYVILLTYDYNSLKPRIMQAVKEETGRELTMGGDIHIKIGLAPTLVAYDVALKNAAWSSQPDMIKIKRTEIKVRLFPLLSRELKIVRLILVEPEILFETDAAGRSNLDFGAQGKFPQITFKAIKIEKGRITYINHGWKKTYAAVVDSMTASAPGSVYGQVRIKAAGSYKNERFDVEGSTGSLAAFEKSSTAWPVKLTVRAGSAVLALDGGIDDPVDMRGIKLNFSVKGSDLARFSRLFGGLPKLQGPFDISGQVRDTGDKAYSVSNLKVLQGASDLYGSMNVNLTGKQPMVKAQLAAKKLDLRPLSHEGTGNGKSSAAKGKVFPATPVPVEPLGQVLNAEVTLRAAEVISHDLQVNNLNTSIILKNGVIDVTSLKANLGNGSVDGRVLFEPKGKTALLTVTMKLSKVDITSPARVIKVVKGVEGKLDADINIRTSGSTVAGLIGASSGKAVFLMGKGRVDNRTIDQLGGGLSSTLFRLLNPFEKEKPYTSINCFVGAFTTTNGLATASTLVLNTQYMVVVGEGTIDLGTERPNLFLKPVPKESVGASLVNKLGIGELTKPLKLTGTLANPDGDHPR
jgi:AsmA family protein